MVFLGFEGAIAILQYLNTHTELQVPSVLSTHVQSKPNYVVTTALTVEAFATHWSSASTSERETVMYQIGQAMANLHSVRVGRSGQILGGNFWQVRFRPRLVGCRSF